MATRRGLDTQEHHTSKPSSGETTTPTDPLSGDEIVIALVKPSQPSKQVRRKLAVNVKENLPRLVDDWLRHIAIDREPDTVTTYRAQLRHFEAWARETSVSLHVESIQKEHIQAYIAAMSAQGRARNTIRIRHAALKAFWTWLVDEDEADKNVAKAVKAIRARKGDDIKIPEVLPDVALTRILRACKGRDHNSRRDGAMVRVLLDTGVRRGELANMEWRNVDLDEQTIQSTGKRGTRQLPFGQHTADALAGYLRAREYHDYAESPMLWLGQMGPLTRMGCYQALKRRVRIAGVPEAHTHLFRHTWAAAYKAAGGSLEDIMALGGWKSSDQALQYGRFTAHKRAMEDYKRRGLGDRV